MTSQRSVRELARHEQ